jgi:prepilin-type N-terminal cleavage/methylation domain-containing protein
MSRINEHKSARAGFTLVELMVATTLTVTLMAGVLSAFLFLGRNLTRLVNMQEQQTKTRRVLRMFSSDVGTASNLTTATSTITGGVTTYAQFVLVPPTGSNVTYTYNLSGNGKLTRQVGAGTAQDQLTNITSFSINYFTVIDTVNGVAFSPTAAAPSNALGVKAVEFQFTTSVGSSAAGTLTTYSATSPRVLLRNRNGLLQ